MRWWVGGGAGVGAEVFTCNFVVFRSQYPNCCFILFDILYVNIVKNVNESILSYYHYYFYIISKQKLILIPASYPYTNTLRKRPPHTFESVILIIFSIIRLV